MKITVRQEAPGVRVEDPFDSPAPKPSKRAKFKPAKVAPPKKSRLGKKGEPAVQQPPLVPVEEDDSYFDAKSPAVTLEDREYVMKGSLPPMPGEESIEAPLEESAEAPIGELFETPIEQSIEAPIEEPKSVSSPPAAPPPPRNLAELVEQADQLANEMVEDADREPPPPPAITEEQPSALQDEELPAEVEEESEDFASGDDEPDEDAALEEMLSNKRKKPSKPKGKSKGKKAVAMADLEPIEDEMVMDEGPALLNFPIWAMFSVVLMGLSYIGAYVVMSVIIK